MQEKYKKVILNPKLWNFTTLVLLEVLFAIGAVSLWNWIMSKELNMVLFGTPELEIIKGVIAIITIDVINKLMKDNKTN